MTYTFKNATIDNFGTHKTTGKPYIRFVAEDGTTNYAYIHPALSYIPTGETYSPIGAIVHNKTVTTVRTVEKKDSNGKRYFNCDAPYPTDEQIEAWERSKQLKVVETETTAEEEARTNF